VSLSASSTPLGVFAVDFVHGYGSERATLQLVNALASEGVAIDLILQDKGQTLIREVHPDVRVLEIGTRNPFSTVLYLYRYLRATTPRALFTIMEKPSLLGIVASALARFRDIVPTIHFDINAYAHHEYCARRKLLRLLIALFYRYAPAVVAVSEGAAEALQPWVGSRTPVVVIPNGFNLAALRARATERPDFRWLNDKTLPVIIGCGRFVPLKGFDVLIKAFARLRAERPARLIILGDGLLRATLQDLVRSLGIEDDVALPGYAENPQAWFAASDLFVLPSRTEGFGNVLLEALASGVPVVSTDCPSGPRTILDSGRYGALVPVDDVEALAVAMTQALSAPRDALRSARVQSYLDEHFSFEPMARAYLALVDRLGS
jgi:glycosyltransferase involved in cell wall biosynthesis